METWLILIGSVLLTTAARDRRLQYPNLGYNIEEDSILKTNELISKYGYSAETHEVVTKDKYILTLHRIPHGRNCVQNETRAPVLLVHGLLGDSSNFIIMGPNKSLGYILAEECYDVWLGNARGNTYSKRHLHMKPNKPAFWNFSWHEIGKYDIPAMIDHILEITGEKSLFYIGHSQGCAVILVCTSLYPEYQNKIRAVFALAPGVYADHIKSPIRSLIPTAYRLRDTARELKRYELLGNSELIRRAGHTACHDNVPLTQNWCSYIIFLIVGFDSEQMNTTMLPVILSHSPAGSSVKQVLHYAQVATSSRFRQYDFGLKQNMRKYKAIQPPDYNLSQIKVPVSIYYGENDWLISPEDINRLASELPNVIHVKKVPHKKFNHLDFIFAMDVNTLVNYDVVNLLKELDNKLH